jgi:hypothetical protein
MMNVSVSTTAGIAANIPIIVGSFFGREATGDVVDPRLVFLERAAARLTLVDAGEMSLDEAISDLVPAFEELRGDGFDELVERLARDSKTRARPRNDGNRDEMSLDALWRCLNGWRPTPQTTIEAILHCVRERGLGALKERKNIERLSRCDKAAREQIDRRIEKNHFQQRD